MKVSRWENYHAKVSVNQISYQARIAADRVATIAHVSGLKL